MYEIRYHFTTSSINVADKQNEELQAQMNRSPRDLPKESHTLCTILFINISRVVFLPKLLVLFPALCLKLLRLGKWRKRHTQVVELFQLLPRHLAALVDAVDANPMG
jgi:hypothetical protein